MTVSGTLLGTPPFMSPEQARSEPVDSRSDLFSLGTLMSTIITGRSPFAAETPFATLSKIVHDDPPPLSSVRDDVPLWLDRLIAKLLCKDPSERFGSADEVARVIALAIRHHREPLKNPVPDVLRDRASKLQLVAAMLAGIALSIPVAMLVQSRTTGNVPVQQTIERPNSTAPIETLDDLERVNLIADLREGVRLEQWLPRLRTMPIGDIPADALVTLEKLRDAEDKEVAEAAGEILNRNPFEVAE